MIDKQIRKISPKSELSTKIWSKGRILPDVRKKLLRVASKLIDKAGLKELGITPIRVTITGSIANYNYGDSSDIDLHIIYKGGAQGELVSKYLSSIKGSFNSDYGFNIEGHEIEVYFQHEDEGHDSSGVYDLVSQQWISEPKPYSGTVDIKSVKEYALDIIGRIKESDTLESIEDTLGYIKKGRKKGLGTEEREYSPENLGYKIARNLGYIDYLYEKRRALDKIETEYGI